MVEVEIDNLIDKAIIESVRKAEKGKLPRKAIIEAVNLRIGRNDQVIAKRIQKISKEPYNYLIDIEKIIMKEKQITGKKKSAIYKLNPEISFIFVGEPLPIIIDTLMVTNEARDMHTSALKEAIETWIAKFPIPHGMALFPYMLPYLEEDRAKSESHLLFQDLHNHLPLLEPNIFPLWNEYKDELNTLDRMKLDLLTAMEEEISKCFPELSLTYVLDYKKFDDYYCSLPSLLYAILLDLVSAKRGRLHIYQKAIRELETSFIYTSEHVLWRTPTAKFMKVPGKDKEILAKGRENVLVFSKNIRHQAVFKSAVDIFEKVGVLEVKRQNLIRMLRDLQQYPMFPGNCKYLAVMSNSNE